MAKEEERRISPALLIVPVVAALGLAVVAGLAFARAAPPKKYVCPYCGAKFSTEAEVLAHIETEHPEEPPMVYYTCTICGAQFSTEEELDTHILSEHPEEVPEIPSGEILDITWRDGANWRLITEPIPANTYVTYRFRVKNTGVSRAAFRIGWTYYSDFMERWYWVYSSPEISAPPGPEASVYIEPGMEGNVDWLLLSGPGIYTITFYLFADDGIGGPEGTPGDALDSITVTITVV